MTSWNRFWIGGGGALLPILLTLLTLDLTSILDNPAGFRPGDYVGAALRYSVLFLLGGIVAALNSSEMQPVQLVQIGIAAPALLSSYVNAAPAKAATAPRSAPSVSLSIDFISTAHAADAVLEGKRIVVADGFFRDVFRSAIAPLSSQRSQFDMAKPIASDQLKAIDQAIGSAKASGDLATAAAEKAAADAVRLKNDPSPATISAIQNSTDKARDAALKAQMDLKILDASVPALAVR